MNVRDTANKKLEKARREGFVLGLKVSYKMLRDAKNHQSSREKKTSNANLDQKEEFEYAAGVLHGLCLKFQEEIKKATLK